MSKALITESILTGIANAIRTKTGETVTMKPTEMAEKIAKISGGGGSAETARKIVSRTITEYSDSELAKVGNSAFNSCTQLTSVDLPACTSVGSNAFNSCTQLTSVDLPVCTSVGNSAFNSCTQLTSVDLPACTSVRDYAFNSCTQLTSVDLPVCTSVGGSAFNSCTQLTSVDLPVCTSVGNYAFYSCSQLKYVRLGYVEMKSTWGSIAGSTATDSLTRLDFPNCTSITSSSAFSSYCPNLSEIHFAVANKEAIEANTYYSTKWGATNATIYFDLCDVTMTISNVEDGATYWLDGVKLTADELANGKRLKQLKSYKILAVSAEGKVYAETFTLESAEDITKTIDFSDCNIPYALNITGAASGVTIQTVFSYGGVSFASIEGTAPSISVKANTEISYVVAAKGYKTATGTIQSESGVTKDVVLTAYTVTTCDMSYPFTGDLYEDILANLVDGSNFEIAESPAVQSGTISSSIVSGSKSYCVNNGISYGYIKFHTPDTEDTELLTVSVTCNAYAESGFDVGAVFIDTKLHVVTSNVRDYTDSTYGKVLYTSKGKDTETYGTYTCQLQSDTDYYLQFAYTKDSSADSGWDRLSITNIKFTDYGTY